MVVILNPRRWLELNDVDSFEFFCHDIVRSTSDEGLFLFNYPKHLFLQSKVGWKVYGLKQQGTKIIVAKIYINLRGNEGNSPLRAPFGSLELYASVSHRNLVELFNKIEADLIRKGVTYLQIRNYPEVYHHEATKLLHKVLDELKYKSIKEVSSVISVDQHVFERKIAISQRQKLRKSEKQFTAGLVKLALFSKIYKFINVCRKEKNQSLSMTLVQFQRMNKVLAKNILLFQVADESHLAAAAIVIKVSDKILYTFYYAHDKKFNKISPVVQLISGIYEYAQARNFTLIDLGTSMVDGKINRSLIQFKKSIGGKPSDKYIFEKTLS